MRSLSSRVAAECRSGQVRRGLEPVRPGWLDGCWVWRAGLGSGVAIAARGETGAAAVHALGLDGLGVRGTGSADGHPRRDRREWQHRRCRLDVVLAAGAESVDGHVQAASHQRCDAAGRHPARHDQSWWRSRSGAHRCGVRDQRPSGDSEVAAALEQPLQVCALPGTTRAADGVRGTSNSSTSWPMRRTWIRICSVGRT